MMEEGRETSVEFLENDLRTTRAGDVGPRPFSSVCCLSKDKKTL
jgi:hypothetical protein